MCKAHSVDCYPPELASETQADGRLSSGKDAQVSEKNMTMMMSKLLFLHR